MGRADSGSNSKPIGDINNKSNFSPSLYYSGVVEYNEQQRRLTINYRSFNKIVW